MNSKKVYITDHIVDYDNEGVYCEIPTNTIPIKFKLPWVLFPNSLLFGVMIKVNYSGKHVGDGVWIEIIHKNPKTVIKPTQESNTQPFDYNSVYKSVEKNNE
jgi:hypothetical protein